MLPCRYMDSGRLFEPRMAHRGVDKETLYTEEDVRLFSDYGAVMLPYGPWRSGCSSDGAHGDSELAIHRYIRELAKQQDKEIPDVPFVYAAGVPSSIDELLHCPETGIVVSDVRSGEWGSASDRPTVPYRPTVPRSVQFITVDPGRQYVGSFHPLKEDWYADAFGYKANGTDP